MPFVPRVPVKRQWDRLALAKLGVQMLSGDGRRGTGVGGGRCPGAKSAPTWVPFIPILNEISVSRGDDLEVLGQ